MALVFSDLFVGLPVLVIDMNTIASGGSSTAILKPYVANPDSRQPLIDDGSASQGNHEHILEEIDWNQRWDALLAKDQAKK